MNKRYILKALIAIFLVRLVFALLPSFWVDMGAWLAWANRLASLGPAKFYSDTVWTQYTPGFLYWLWGIGKAGWVQPLAIKIPVILADMLTGYLIWLVVKMVSRKWANWMYVLYVLSPVAIIDGSIWGQIDGILTLAMFGSIYLLIEKKNVYLSWIVMGGAFLIKPQAVAILPLLVIVTIVKRGWRRVFGGITIAATVILLGYFPFFPHNPLTGMVALIQKMGVSYPYTSLFAFNLWSYVGMWKSDSIMWGELSYFGWGMLSMMVGYLTVLIKYRKDMKTANIPYLVGALSCYIFYLFPTRVHERYLFPMFAFLLAYIGIGKKKVMMVIAAVAMVVYSLNLYLPYSYYESALNPLKNVVLENLIWKWIPILSTIQIAIFVFLVLFPARKNIKKAVPIKSGDRVTKKHGRY